MRKLFGIVFITVGILLILYVLYQNSIFSTKTRIFSPYTLLSSSWEKYKIRFINNDGRVIDYSQNAITTSEGQSYAMLRSVWMDDRETFDKTWRWTRLTLKRPDDPLFGWRWGKRNGGTYGFIQGGGDNTASDADQDIALALILASRRWKDPSYQNQAKPILLAIWKTDTAVANGKRYMTAGNWAENDREIIINPSYFAPYAWRIFAKIDRAHNWNALIAPSYDLLDRAGKADLGGERGVGLPPDWVVMDKQTGSLSAPQALNLNADYSFDAMRVPWRIALDYQWNNSERAKSYLASSFKFLSDSYAVNRILSASYSHSGRPLKDIENPAMYATSIGYFALFDKQAAQTIYSDKIIRLYANDRNSFRDDLPYYEQNWLWFGAALYNKFLVDFS